MHVRTPASFSGNCTFATASSVWPTFTFRPIESVHHVQRADAERDVAETIWPANRLRVNVLLRQLGASAEWRPSTSNAIDSRFSMPTSAPTTYESSSGQVALDAGATSPASTCGRSTDSRG